MALHVLLFLAGLAGFECTRIRLKSFAFVVPLVVVPAPGSTAVHGVRDSSLAVRVSLVSTMLVRSCQGQLAVSLLCVALRHLP